MAALRDSLSQAAARMFSAMAEVRCGGVGRVWGSGEEKEEEEVEREAEEQPEKEEEEEVEMRNRITGELKCS